MDDDDEILDSAPISKSDEELEKALWQQLWSSLSLWMSLQNSLLR